MKVLMTRSSRLMGSVQDLFEKGFVGSEFVSLFLRFILRICSFIHEQSRLRSHCLFLGRIGKIV